MPTSFLVPPLSYKYRRAWYARPVFYVPAVIVLLLLFAGAIYFALLASQLKAQATTYDLSKLDQMESASVILDRNGKIFGQIYVENRQTIPYDQIPRDLVNAVVATEDSKFYQHGGYDPWGIVRAALKNVTAGHVRQGASTITQQLARNSFSLKERTFRRKLLEIFLAERIEHALGKQKIMELYLNRIYFGGGLYGAEAAARGYFDKPASQMTLTECATLAGLIKSPNRLSPWTDRAAARETRNVVLARMRELGFIDRQRCESAQSTDLLVGDRQSAQGQTYAVDLIRQKVIETVGWDRAMNEGFRIHTTIDADLQKAAEESLRSHLDAAEKHPGYDHQTYAEYAANFRKGHSDSEPRPEYLQGAVIALDNKTGGILALVGGRDFEHNQYDRALQARRPAGTAITPFVFAAAFADGLFPGSIVEDSALDNRAVMIGGRTGILGEWGPESADNRYEGPITAREALAKSKNGATVRIGMEPGVDSVVELMHNAGIKSPLRPYPATFLGSSEVTLAELALAYTIFPNGGMRPNAPHVLESIEEKDGTIWHAERHDGKMEKVIAPEIAYEVHSCLRDVLDHGTGKAARTQFGLKQMDAGGKTGTAYDFTDVLFAGYDSSVTCAVWAGFDKPQRIFRGAFGHDIALPVWVDVMNTAAQHFPAKQIPQPGGLELVNICSKSGLLGTDKCVEQTPNGEVKTTYDELATAAQRPTEPCNVHGGARASFAQELPPSEFPRASLAADTSSVTPVTPKGPTLLAERDPYNAVHATLKLKPAATPAPSASPAAETSEKAVAEEMPDPSKPVLKAQPVQRDDAADAPPADTAAAVPSDSPVEIRRAVPVEAASPAPTPPKVRRAIPVEPSNNDDDTGD
ncbi:MAG: PBP1A family penicillin-binding protein [Verrucomicrobia bacterium]|nr:PBP1A family penicillin-binding protein [Verrucomicrobiota bacterium]